jgi:hypothetical protein
MVSSCGPGRDVCGQGSRRRQSGDFLGWGRDPHAPDGPPVWGNTLDAANLHTRELKLGYETRGQLDPRGTKLVVGNQLSGSTSEDAQHPRLLGIAPDEVAICKDARFALLRRLLHSPTSDLASGNSRLV